MSQPPYDDQPVRNGLLALAGVSLAVGLVVAIVALIGVHILGLAGGGGGDGAAGAGQSMYVPPPQKTIEAGGPQVTLNTEATSSASPSKKASKSAKPKPKKGQISLQALETTVPNFGKIDLTGTYPGGEGEILDVQRKENGKWAKFPVTVSVSGNTFSTYIQSSQAGKNDIRVYDPTHDIASNPVSVTVGG